MSSTQFLFWSFENVYEKIMNVSTVVKVTQYSYGRNFSVLNNVSYISKFSMRSVGNMWKLHSQFAVT